MNIYGFDKTSLLNYPEHVAATVFTGGCNMRCPFCHNGELVLNPPADMRISEEEVLNHLQKRRIVLTGLCITGGEPTLQPDLRVFIEKVRALGYKIKLDTNGLKPDILAELLDAGLLDYVAMDIKAGRDNYAAAAGLLSDNKTKVADIVSESMEMIISSAIDYEFRTTVVNGIHSVHDFEDIRDWMKEILSSTGSDRIRAYYLQPYVVRDTVLDSTAEFSTFSYEQLKEIRALFDGIAEKAEVRGVDE